MTQLYVRGTSRRWRATGSLEWAIGGKHVEHVVTLPAGQEFESSVPWWGRWFINRDDPRFLLAARVHDYLLEHGYGRPQAAAEWYDGTRTSRAPLWKSKIAYIAVAAWAVIGGK